MLKKYLKNLSLLFFSTLITLIIINFVLSTTIKQKNFIFSKLDQNRMTYLQKVMFPDIYQNFDNHNLFIGDSYAFGNGDSQLNGDYDYSIAHHLKNYDLNILNTALPGHDSPRAVSHALYIYDLIKNSIFLKDKVGKPDKILFFFYEGNDVVHNSRKRYLDFFNEKNKCSNIKKKINYKDILFESNFFIFKFLYYNIRHQLNFSVQKGNLVSILKIILPESFYNTLETKFGREDPKKIQVNEVLFQNGSSHLTGHLQFPAYELTEKDVDLSFSVLDNSLNCLNSTFKDIKKYFIYLPAPTVLYDFNNNEIIVQSDFDINKYEKINVKNFLNLSREYQNLAKKYSLKNDFIFIDIRDDLLKITKNEFIHGDIDIHHFNYRGYNVTADLVYEKVFK